MRPGTLFLVLIALPTCALAQQPGMDGSGGYGGFGRGRGTGGRPQRSAPAGELSLIPPEAEPPPVDSIGLILNLDTTLHDRYAADWDSLQHDTRPIRESLVLQDSVARFALAQGYEHAAKERIEIVNRLAKTLHQRNDLFAHRIGTYLSKDQMKLYRKYLDDRKDRPMPEAPMERRRRPPTA